MSSALLISALIAFASFGAHAQQQYAGSPLLAKLLAQPTTSLAETIAPPALTASVSHSLSQLSAAVSSTKTISPSFFDTKTTAFPTFGKCSLPKDEKPLNVFNVDTRLGSYFSNVFKAVSKPLAEGKIDISRFDLWHAHLFINHDNLAVSGAAGSRQNVSTIGLVFHSQEYPALSDEFPYPLGHCQVNSTVKYDSRRMARRNFVWIMPNNDPTVAPPKLLRLDADVRTGDEDVDDALPEAPFYTLDEYQMGKVVADFYFLPQTDGVKTVSVSLY
ncbi:hypothetical protein DFS34DRAFT_616896 [Phlyctochytrium arcticum]|nr:hypothetical protein DFS34DRAFT_616896 [Phlyctochytrium arcticum]